MCTPDSIPTWLDEHQPHDHERSKAQIEAVLTQLGPESQRVLDLGCGAGRIMLPMVRAGHEVVGLDLDDKAIMICQQALDAADVAADRARLVQADFLSTWPDLGGAFDAVCLLGNTIMTIVGVDAAIDLLGRICRSLKPAGMLLIDDCPFDFCPELTEGNWINGLSEEGGTQLIWDTGDLVFTLRLGDEVDTNCWRLRDGDRRFRLWTMGCLDLATRLAGLSAPIRDAGGGLLIMRRPDR